MPTYTYKCEVCGIESDHFHSMNSEPVNVCPVCKSEGKMEKLIGHSVSFIFKGHGTHDSDKRIRMLQEEAAKGNDDPEKGYNMTFGA